MKTIFGIYCQNIPMQINYLTNELTITGEGANEVLSMFHHFFETHDLAKTQFHLHDDYCVGQIKRTH